MTNIDIAALWTSPLRRARETADVVGSVLGLDPVELPELRESARGRWEGRRLEQIERDNPALYAEFVAGDPDFAFPGGEPFRTHVVRTRKALTVILSGERPALVITHAGTIRAALAAFGFSLPPESALGHGEVAWPRRLRPPH